MHKGSLPDDLLKFVWVDDINDKMKMPTYTDSASKATFEYAFLNSNISLHESWVNTLAHFRKLNIKICQSPHIQTSNYVSSRHIANLMNSSMKKNVIDMISATNKYIKVRGRLLAYGISQLYKCNIMIFSTRRKPCKINPNGVQSDDIPCLYLLERKDSYFGFTAYYALKARKSPKKKQEETLSLNKDVVVAKLRGAEEKKPRKAKHKLGTTLDALVVNYIEEEANRMYESKWKKFKKVEKNKKKTVDDFKATLSMKEIPTGVVPVVKARVEQMLREGEVAGLSANDIPKSGAWLGKKVHTLKKQGKLSVEGLIDGFINILKNNQNNEDPVEIQEYEDEPSVSEVIEVDENNYRTVSRSLKRTINHSFDYNTLNTRLDDLQDSCTRVIAGLSKSVHILINLIISGKICTDEGDERKFFKLNDIDLNANGIGKDESDIYLSSKEVIKNIETHDLFSFRGFWMILSTCVGEKSVKKKGNM